MFYNLAIAILFLFVIMMAETFFTPLSDKQILHGKTSMPYLIEENEKLTDGQKNVTKVSNSIEYGNILELSLPTSDFNSTFNYLNFTLINPKKFINSTINFNSLSFQVLSTSIYILLFYPLNLWAKEETEGHSFNYFYSSYTSEFQTFNDIQLLGFMIYLAFPFITILLGVLLWCVLIGVLRISGN